MKKIIIFFICLLCVIYSCSTDKKNTEYIKKSKKEIKIDSTSYYDSIYAPISYKIDTFFQRRFEEKTFNGVILFSKNNRIVIKEKYGFSSLEKKDSLTMSSTFQLASVSKIFTAIACLQLIEQGKLKLTDTIQKYIEKFPYSDITIHQLLSHRSGLSEYTHFCDNPDSIWKDKHKTITNEDVLDIIIKHKPNINYKPNTRFYYCNTNYIILASIIEKITNLKFEEYLYKNIFNPLNMKSTVVYNRDNKESLINPVTAYNGAYNTYINIYLNGVVGDKGVYSNVDDMFLFYKGLISGKLISKETILLAKTKKNESKKNKKNYGYGFRILEQPDGNNIIFHTGWWKGFRTYFITNNEFNKLVIVLTNLKRGPFLSVEELLNLLD